ncbi:hypothetical protein GcC1_c1735o90 [Golovinomyces cichoracearum]|uniref:Uncharacterized protein n=1 Tax=Golovinomyces cichoracearum TaxID=62708 RepID=A0A420IUF2_9PEZI|nr:hypothetical protein GcC1_c1735o90 [Golovinomyces cichoracearum]
MIHGFYDSSLQLICALVAAAIILRDSDNRAVPFGVYLTYIFPLIVST